MKDRSVAMHPRAQPPDPLQLQRKHALMLVCGVLLLHLWLLAGSPLWFSSDSDQQLQTHAFVTRQIQIAAPRAPHVPTPAPATTSPKPSAETSDPAAAAHTPAAQPLKFDDLGNDLTAPVSLPARTASGVDLPPYKTSAGAEGPTPASAFKAPDSALLKYQVQGKAKGFDYWASAELLWTQNGTDYEARLEVSAFLLGSRVQVSKGQLGAEGLMPIRFGDKTRSELAAHFQRDKGIISFSANSPDAPLLKGAQDRLSVVLQISSLLAADPTRYPLGTMLSFQTVSQREAEIWHFLVEKEETLQLPFGEARTVKLNRKPRRDFDQQIELWFAPDLGYLPVRLRITNANGDIVDQLLNKVSMPGS